MGQTQGKQDDTSNPGDAPQSYTDSQLGYPKRKKKKRGSSAAARRLEDVEKRVSRSAHRVTKAVNKGVTTYIDKRKKSARKRRDGALVDIYQNVAKGLSKGLSRSAPVLTDVAKAANTRRLRKRIRRGLRGIPVIG